MHQCHSLHCSSKPVPDVVGVRLGVMVTQQQDLTSRWASVHDLSSFAIISKGEISQVNEDIVRPQFTEGFCCPFVVVRRANAPSHDSFVEEVGVSDYPYS